MERKKLIRKISMITLSVFVISLIFLLTLFPIRSRQWKNHEKKMEEHLELLTTNYQQFLSEAAQKINHLPVDPLIVKQLSSKILQERPKVKLYLWMLDSKGNFIFGCPPEAFNILNNAYDRFQTTIINDGRYLSRNDFLFKLIDKYEVIDFSKFKKSTNSSDDGAFWRFYQGSVASGKYQHTNKIVLSAPVSNDKNEAIGELFLKIDDYKNKKIYFSKFYFETNDFFSNFEPPVVVLIFFSLLFLWFLLPSWVYVDARERDMEKATLWGVFTLFSGIFGLVIYLIIRPTTLKSITCPECGKDLNGSKAYCPYCGFDVSSFYCPECQYPVQKDWLFCPNCRADLKKQKIDKK